MEGTVGRTVKKRLVLGISAIRSEYFLQRPIFRAIMEHPELQLGLVVTGAHLSPLHGHSAQEIEADGFPIAARIENLLSSDRDAGRLMGGALQLQVLAQVVDALRPDWLLAPGDREEALTMALCGAYMNIATAHYGAGDRVVGNVDDMVRHAVSRLSHVLFTTNEDARQRLIRAGEQEWRVHNVGHAGLDRFRTTRVLDRETLARMMGIPEVVDPYLIVIQHPLSSEIEQAGVQMRETLAAVVDVGHQAIVSYPNSDPGSQDIIRAIEGVRDRANIHIFRTIPDEVFANLLRGAAMLVGNSSLGIMEAPYLKLPVINVGRRQEARYHSENVFFVPHDQTQIARQIRMILQDGAVHERVQRCANPFGDGHTGERVAHVLAATPVDNRLLNKDLSY